MKQTRSRSSLARLKGRIRFSIQAYRRAQAVAVLGSAPAQRAWIRCVPVLLLWTGATLPVRIRWRGRVLRLRLSDLSEFEVLREVFADEEYADGLPREADTVLDLGANIGLASLYFGLLWPSAHIIAVEPNPLLQRRLRFHLSQLSSVEQHAVAVARTPGTARLQVNGESWRGTLGDTGVEVQTCTLADLIDRPIGLLKFDIEGSEFDVFPEADLGAVRALVGEVHDAGPRGASFVRGLGDRGFDIACTSREGFLLVRGQRVDSVAPTATG
jgi:FkbM family methyltransferase